MNEQRPERESIWSIGRKWLPWYLVVIFAMTVGWTAFTAWRQVGVGGEGLPEIAESVVRGTAPAAPLIPIYALLVISTLDVLGGGIVVTARYLTNRFLRPLIERRREEGRKEGRQEGRQEGREEERRLWKLWNQRRLEAEERGEPFVEPPPGSA